MSRIILKTLIFCFFVFSPSLENPKPEEFHLEDPIKEVKKLCLMEKEHTLRIMKKNRIDLIYNKDQEAEQKYKNSENRYYSIDC